MKFLEWFRPASPEVSVQTARQAHDLLPLNAPGAPDYTLYEQLRASAPIVDAAIGKIVRLTGGFSLHCEDPHAQALLDQFASQVQVGASGRGLHSFVSGYLDSLLTYGSSVGEIVLSPNRRRIAALYQAPLRQLELRPGSGPLEFEICTREGVSSTPVRHPELILFTPLSPRPGEILGHSILEGLPSVCSVLLKIYQSIGNNFERIANLRYAVTYRPQTESDRACAQDIARSMAAEWSSAMSMSRDGQIRDFVAVGDVDIQVIGADTQMIDTQVPVRQMLEEIIAKLGIPPFLLGLSWSTTERMSRQQADLLTSELESYRSLLTPVIERICTLFLRLEGYGCIPKVDWENISLMDETELAQARLTAARAAQLEQQQGGTTR